MPASVAAVLPLPIAQRAGEHAQVIQVELPARSHGGQLLGKAVQMVNRRCVGHAAILVCFRRNQSSRTSLLSESCKTGLWVSSAQPGHFTEIETFQAQQRGTPAHYGTGHRY